MPETTPPSNPQAARLQLLILMLIPIAVVGLATFVFYTGIGMPEGTRNKGVLLVPPQQINALELKTETGAAVRLEGERDKLWAFLVARPAGCDRECQRQLWEIRQTHVALGKFQSHIQRIWLVTEGRLDEKTQQWLRDEQPGWQVIYADGPAWSGLVGAADTGEQSKKDARFYLVDPRGFVMMYYRWENTYKDVITDMKFLLKGVE